MVSITPRSHFTPGKDPLPILQDAGWAPGPVWTGGKSRIHFDVLANVEATIEITRRATGLDARLQPEFNNHKHRHTVRVHTNITLHYGSTRNARIFKIRASTFSDHADSITAAYVLLPIHFHCRKKSRRILFSYAK